MITLGNKSRKLRHAATIRAADNAMHNPVSMVSRLLEATMRTRDRLLSPHPKTGLTQFIVILTSPPLRQASLFSALLDTLTQMHMDPTAWVSEFIAVRLWGRHSEAENLLTDAKPPTPNLLEGFDNLKWITCLETTYIFKHVFLPYGPQDTHVN